MRFEVLKRFGARAGLFQPGMEFFPIKQRSGVDFPVLSQAQRDGPLSGNLIMPDIEKPFSMPPLDVRAKERQAAVLRWGEPGIRRGHELDPDRKSVDAPAVIGRRHDASAAMPRPIFFRDKFINFSLPADKIMT